MREYKQAMRVGGQIEIKTTDGKSYLEAQRVLGGIHPGSEISPFYACAFAQIPHRNQAGKKKLVFLFEVAQDLPERFFSELLKEASAFLCWNWFYNVSDADEAAFKSFDFLLNQHSGKVDMSLRIRLMQPATTLDWNTGVLSLQQWVADKSLEISPGTELGVQLGKMTKADRSPRSRDKFYAVDAVRAIMAQASTEYRGYSGPIPEERTDFFYG